MKIKHLLLLPIAIILCACSMAEDIKEADSAVGSFLDGRINTGTMGNDDFYSVLFKEATSEEEWGNIQALVTKAHGALVSYEKVSWRLNNQAHTSELSGTFVYYVFDTKYERGLGTEQITLFKNSDNPSFKIINHHFNSEEIQALVRKGIAKAAE